MEQKNETNYLIIMRSLPNYNFLPLINLNLLT